TKDYIMVFKYVEVGNNMIRCKKCYEQYSNFWYKWCELCLRANFTNWTCGNEKIDNFIQEMQLKSNSPYIFGWIPYNQFSDIKVIDNGIFAAIYSAVWKDGPLLNHDQEKLIRKSDGKVVLKCLYNLPNIINEF